MPSPELATLQQRALVWMATGADSYGQPVVSDSPQEIVCRVVGSAAEVMDKNRSTITLDAKATVAIDIPIGSQMWFPPRGVSPLAGYQALVSSGPVDVELYEVKTASPNPDIKSRVYIRTIGLFRFRATKG